jgi:2,3-dihydro-2,3-dihydroxybenzoate dehydrogenase
VALVTGAAGGIGAAVVAELAGRGATVAVTDRDLSAAEAVAEEHPGARAYRLDVTDPVAAAAVVEQVEAGLGPVETLVNVAGVLRPATVAELDETAWDRHLAVNATGVFTVSRLVGARMAERGRGSIVTVGSNAVAVPRVGMAAYAASKAAATAFTRCLGLELAPRGVRCNVVSPGSTRTAMLETLWDGRPGAREDTLSGSPADFRLGIPLARIADPADVAAAVGWLASPAARHVTLHDLRVDGGATLGA